MDRSEFINDITKALMETINASLKFRLSDEDNKELSSKIMRDLDDFMTDISRRNENFSLICDGFYFKEYFIEDDELIISVKDLAMQITGTIDNFIIYDKGKIPADSKDEVLFFDNITNTLKDQLAVKADRIIDENEKDI